MSTITFSLSDESKLDSNVGAIYVAGWINGGGANFKILGSNGKFARLPTDIKTLPFYELSKISKVTLTDTTNGNDRLLFTAAPNQPTGLSLLANSKGVYDNVQMYTQYPFLATPGAAPEGPFDVFEFGMNAAFDVSAVNGFALNLRFAVPKNSPSPAESYGVRSDVTRKQIGDAFKAFVGKQTGIPGSSSFGDLYYNGAMPGSKYDPPMLGDQFFAIADPNDFLAASTNNYATSTTSGLQTYWTATLQKFFTEGNKLAIEVPHEDDPTNVFSGSCVSHPHPKTGTKMLAYELTNSAGKKEILLL